MDSCAGKDNDQTNNWCVLGDARQSYVDHPLGDSRKTDGAKSCGKTDTRNIGTTPFFCVYPNHTTKLGNVQLQNKGPAFAGPLECIRTSPADTSANASGHPIRLQGQYHSGQNRPAIRHISPAICQNIPSVRHHSPAAMPIHPGGPPSPVGCSASSHGGSNIIP